MSIDVRRADESDLERWDSLVDQSPHGTPFHRRGFVETLAAHADAPVHPLVGYKGQEPVGLFPIYQLRKGPVTAAVSPPPDLKVSYQGPALLNLDKLKHRKREKRHRRFVDAALEWIADELAPKYTHVRTGYRYTDPRPFVWNDFEVTPGYTYVVDLSPGADDLLQSFSSDARQNIRATNDADADVEVTLGGADAIRRIVGQVKARHDAQNEPYRVTPEFVVDLYQTVGNDVVRPYVCTVDGEFAGGMVALESGDTVYRWQGGAKPDTDLDVNDAVDWHIMRDAMDRGVRYYDLVGANNQRLCGYKAKWAPDLRQYQSVERGSRSMNVAKGLYQRIRK